MITLTVSIISRNRSGQLRRCLNSLVRQGYKNFKVLVVDNNSTDNTKIVVESFAKKLKIFYILETRVGRGSARNRVLSEMKGDILATIDDDCEAERDWTRNIIKIHKVFPEVVAVHGWAISYPRDSYISIIAQFIKGNNLILSIIGSHNFSLNGQFVNKSVYTYNLDTKNASFKVKKLKNLGVKFNTNFRHSEDFQFAKQILAKGKKIVFDPTIVVHHWERPELSGFFGQRFYTSGEILRTEKSWPKKYFPKRNRFWIVTRLTNFIKYLSKNKHMKKSHILIPLFLVEESIFTSGKIVEAVGSKLKRIF